MTKKENQKYGIWIMAGEVIAFAVILVVVITLMGCSQSGADTVLITRTMVWTATGDDGVIGSATAYDLRMATSENALQLDWDIQPQIDIPFAPAVAGTPETLVVTLVLETEQTYYFAIKAVDNNGNWSPISNVSSFYVPDETAPAYISDLRIIEL